MLQPRVSFWLVASTLACSALLVGCASVPNPMPGLDRPIVFSPADFDNTSMYTRHVSASQSKTCEAARRALLSQGYLVNTATDELVTGRKYFQPTTDIHYQVEMRVVCATDGKNDDKTAAYASALQDRYVVKKINNSASLGVGAIGSVSLPVSATEDTLVKVGSETVSDPRFYELFFQLFDRYVPTSTPNLKVPEPQSKASAAPATKVEAYHPQPAAVVETHPVTASQAQAYDVETPEASRNEVGTAGAPANASEDASSPIDSVIERLAAEQSAADAQLRASRAPASPSSSQ